MTIRIANKDYDPKVNMVDTKVFTIYRQLPDNYKSSISSNNFNNVRNFTRAVTLFSDIQKKGFKILSDYVNHYCKIKIECPQGHIFTRTARNINDSIKCLDCEGKSHNCLIQKITDKINSFGYILDTPVEDIINYTAMFKIRCLNNHITEYNSITLFTKKNDICNICNKIRKRKEIESYLFHTKNLIFIQGRLKDTLFCTFKCTNCYTIFKRKLRSVKRSLRPCPCCQKRYLTLRRSLAKTLPDEDEYYHL